MTAIPGSVRFTGFIAPSDSTDTYAVTDDVYHRGGFRPVANTTARDAITADRRKQGMWVYSIADAKTYTLSGGITNGDWVEVTMGGAPIAPEFSLVSPRAIVTEDHGKQLLAAAMVGGGFLYNIDHSVAAGTTVRISCLGLTLKVICGTDTIILGSGPFSTGIVGLGFADLGHYVDLTYLGEVSTGVYGWGIIGGSGVATEVDSGGDFTSLRFVFDSVIPDSLAGNILTVDSDLQVVDSGVAITALQAAYVTTFGATAVDLIDDTDFVAVELSPYVTEATGYIIEVTPSTGTGSLTVILYQDAARLEVVYTMVVDLTDATTFRTAEAFGMYLETAGTIYATAFVSGVGASETFDIDIRAIGLQPTAPPAPMPGPYGQGIEDNGGGLPRVALASDGGLGFDINDKLVIVPDVTADVTLSLGIAGASVTGAVTTTTDEDIVAKKRFTAVGVEPQLTAGPPAAGTYLAGQEILDSNHVKWRCSSDGTPGNWLLADCVADASADYYTSVLAAGASEVIEILTTGDVGFIQCLQIWGVVVTTVDEYSSDFRARIYKTSDTFGRDVIWQGVGIARQSFLTAILPDSTTDASVNDIDMFETDDACVVFEDFERYEMARIFSRGAGIITFDEALIDPSSWAANTLVCGVTQFENVPFRNIDGTPANRGRAFLQIRNDHGTNDVQFFVRALPLSIGIGQEMLS